MESNDQCNELRQSLRVSDANTLRSECKTIEVPNELEESGDGSGSSSHYVNEKLAIGLGVGIGRFPDEGGRGIVLSMSLVF